MKICFDLTAAAHSVEIDFGRVLSSSEKDALFAYQNTEPSPSLCMGDARRLPSCDQTRMITIYLAPALVIVKCVKVTPEEIAEFRRVVHEGE
jgi:hypothetical protein